MPDQAYEPVLTFAAFVLSLASTAAIHFGDLPDPQSGERAEPNLEGAAQMIEILALLDVKTKGNLTAEERQLLEQLDTKALAVLPLREKGQIESVLLVDYGRSHANIPGSSAR